MNKEFPFFKTFLVCSLTVNVCVLGIPCKICKTTFLNEFNYYLWYAALCSGYFKRTLSITVPRRCKNYKHCSHIGLFILQNNIISSAIA